MSGETGRVRRDTWVPLKDLLEFPELKQWSVDRDQAIEAIRQSSHLTLSEDGETVQRSHRPPPFEFVSNTIYVYNLPNPIPSAEWFENAFSRFGRVYGSNLCKYRESGLPKGKLFLDFALDESAKLAVNYFRAVALKQIQADQFFTEDYQIDREKLCEEEIWHLETQSKFFNYIDDILKQTVSNGEGFDSELYAVAEAKLKQQPLSEQEEQWFNNLHVIFKSDCSKFHRESGLYEGIKKSSHFERRRGGGNRGKFENGEQPAARQHRPDRSGRRSESEFAPKSKQSVDNLRQSFLPDSVVKVVLHESNHNTRIGELKLLVREEFARCQINRESIVYLDMKGDNRDNPNIYIRCIDADIAREVAGALEPIGEASVITGDDHERYVNRACRTLAKKYDGGHGPFGRSSRAFGRRGPRDAEHRHSSYNSNHNTSQQSKHATNTSQQSEGEQEHPTSTRHSKRDDGPPREPRVHNYEPGCIVKIEFIVDESGGALQSIGNAFKAQIRQLPYQTGIVYAGIDFGDRRSNDTAEAGEKQCGFIRFDTAENAERFLEQDELKSLGEPIILSGDEEHNYIEQIMRIRQRKNYIRRTRSFARGGGRSAGGRGASTAVRRRSARHSVDSD